MRPIRPSGSADVQPVLKPKACVPCRTRKVKCNRGSPCSNCSNWSLECVFPSPKRTSRRRPKVPASPTSNETGPHHPGDSPVEVGLQTIEEILRQLEHFIQGQDQGVLTGRGRNPSSGELIKSSGTLRRLQAIQAGLRGTIGPATACSTGYPATTGGHTPWSQAPATFLFPTLSPDTFSFDVAIIRPSPMQLQTCWRVFLQKIDPLVKVLHRGSTERILRTVLNDEAAVGESALVFAICLSSLSTMSPMDAENCFNAPKQTTLVTYRQATENALMRANLLTTESLTTLQAFGLYLSINRFTDDSHHVWAMTSLASRLSYTSNAYMSPFEQEMRRRLRWKLWYLDHRAHEDRGQGFTPPDTAGLPDLPVNARDVDMDPKMTAPPKHCLGWTEVSFSLIQFDIAATACVVRVTAQPQDRENIINGCERRLRSAYLKYCDGTEGIHWLAQHVSHVLIMELHFRLHGQPHIMSASDSTVITHPVQDQLFSAAVDILDTQRRIEKEPGAAQWIWLLSAYMQFWPLSFVLGELCYRRSSRTVDRAWEVAEGAFRRWNKDDRGTGNIQILNRLIDRAKAARSTMVWDDSAFAAISLPR